MANNPYNFRDRGKYHGFPYDIKANSKAELELKREKKFKEIENKTRDAAPTKAPLFRKKGTYSGIPYDIKATTETELEAKYQKKIIEIEKRHLTKGSSTLLNEWFDRYMDMYVDKHVSYQTYKDRQRIYNKWIKPQIGSHQIGSITSTECQSILNNMSGHSKDYINKVAQLLYNIFRKARAAKLIYENPAEDLSRPIGKNGIGRAATLQERALMLMTAPKHRGGLWLKCILYLGMRPGETFRFQGKHINYNERLIYIDGTKSAAAKRIVPAPENLLCELRKYDKSPGEYIFQNMHGDPLKKSSADNMWHSFKNAMNLTAGCKLYRNKVVDPVVAGDLIPYYFRHAFATDLKDANIPYPIRQELLGHSDGSVTDRYTHRTETSLRIAARLIDEYRAKQEKEIKSIQEEIMSKGYNKMPEPDEDLTNKFFPNL